jgi:hypothetical protein
MNGTIRKLVVSTTLASGMRARLWSSIAVLPALCLFVLPTCASAACGRFGVTGSGPVVKLPVIRAAASGVYSPFDPEYPPIVGLWHVIYTNSADQSTFNDTFDTWHIDGTEFESAYLAPAGGNICVGVWKESGKRSVTLHHLGWLFNPSTPLATASNSFTIDSEITVAEDGKAYSGNFTFKVWNLDGTPTPVEVKGTIAATRITVD